jgi:stage V sporulation protein SpoVS
VSQKPQVLLRGEDRAGGLVGVGAITTSVKISAIAFGRRASSGRFSATIPPKAEVRSQSKRPAIGLGQRLAPPTPQGLACLMITQAGPSPG